MTDKAVVHSEDVYNIPGGSDLVKMFTFPWPYVTIFPVKTAR